MLVPQNATNMRLAIDIDTDTVWKDRRKKDTQRGYKDTLVYLVPHLQLLEAQENYNKIYQAVNVLSSDCGPFCCHCCCKLLLSVF